MTARPLSLWSRHASSRRLWLIAIVVAITSVVVGALPSHGQQRPRTHRALMWLEVRPGARPLVICVGETKDLLVQVYAIGGASILRMNTSLIPPRRVAADNSETRNARLVKKENQPGNYGVVEPYRGERYDITGVRPGRGTLTFTAALGDAAAPASTTVDYMVTTCDYTVSTVQTLTVRTAFLAMTMDDVQVTADESGRLSGTGVPDWVVRVHGLPCDVRPTVNDARPVAITGELTDDGLLNLDVDHADVSLRMAMRCPRLRGANRTWTDTWGLSDRHVAFPGDGGAVSTTTSLPGHQETVSITIEPVERTAVTTVGSRLLFAAVEASPPPAPVPTASPTPSGVELTFEVADGPFDLLDPTVGLADRTSYVAKLTNTFEGIVAGEPTSVATTTTLRVGPAGRELTIERGPDGPTTWRAEVRGAAYARDGDGPCMAASISEGGPIAQLFEPAAELPAVFGASAAAGEAMEGVPASHHTFDASSLLLVGPAEASGDVWAAESDGHVMRYHVRLEAGPEVLGEGVSGTRGMDYELSTPEKPVVLDLPADCPRMVDAPVLDDATDVVRRPGIMSFRSPMAIAKAARTYTRQLRDKGWKPTFPAEVTKTTALLGFRKGKRELTVVLRRRAGETRAHLAITR